MTHTLVISKTTGLVRDEYYCIPPIIKKHEDKMIDGVMQDCFVFKFASGNYAFYSNKDYRYELRSGFAI